MSYPRRYSLTSKAEFKHVFDQPFKISKKHILILFKPSQKTYAKVGVIVGKRVSNSAVVRNKIKRIFRESFRHYHTQLAGWNIVIIAKPHCDTLSNVKLRKDIDDLWEKLLTQYQKRLSA